MPRTLTDAVYEMEPFDEEERALIESVERGEWRSVMTPQSKAELEQMARSASNQDNNHEIQVRVSEKELSQIQNQANQAGISSDRWIHKIIRQYLSGELEETSSH